MRYNDFEMFMSSLYCFDANVLIFSPCAVLYCTVVLMCVCRILTKITYGSYLLTYLHNMYLGLGLGLWLMFLSRSVHARLQVSIYQTVFAALINRQRNIECTPILLLYSGTKCQLLWWTLLLFSPRCIYACAVVFFDATVFSVNKDLDRTLNDV